MTPLRDRSIVDLYNAVARRELTAEQAVDEMERRERVLRGPGRAWMGTLFATALSLSGVAVVALGHTLAGVLILVAAAIYGADAWRTWRAWRKATRPEVRP